MGLVRDLVTMGRAAREAEELKVRQPIARVLVSAEHEDKINDLIPLLKEELNVKEVQFTSDPSKYMEYEVKPNFEVVGPQLRDKVKLFASKLSDLDAAETAKELEAGEELSVDLDGEEFSFTEDEVIINISSREGYSIGMEDNEFIILETELTEKLKAEGYAREFISRVQTMRKEHDFDVLDRIKITYSSEQEIEQAVDEFYDYISEETLADEIKAVDNLENGREYELNGVPAIISVERLSQ